MSHKKLLFSLAGAYCQTPSYVGRTATCIHNLQNKGCGDKPFSYGKTNQAKLYIILKGIYWRFRISLNNWKIIKIRDF